MHPTAVDIGAFLRSATPDGKIQGYPPSLLSAGTDYGDAFSVVGARSCMLTVSTGAATGTPATQKATVSLESAPPGASPTWVTVENSTVDLTADETSDEVDLNLTRLPSGHTQLRCKVVTVFTGGSSPKQYVAASVTLGGFSTLPV
ncbi:hypothetical protein CYFUS_006600 [Cystobacter fuscus]|uniref:Uncharacterized protein n=1 Tax=Cystobacter fuscus TaxID=43 RepID=A0A250JC52_9BACT|nr:hypothetical protein [Cystobacter fuscus]ATB41138.1 hypothetical protein CYFUS_006600 [Cystobacter fuscus]